MNVSLQNTDKASALLTVEIYKADYEAKADKSLRQLRQKVQMPGFRPGKVPLPLVKRMYGTSVLAEEVNKLLGEAVYDYLQNNNVDILGEPLPSEQQPTIDFEKQEAFTFLFDLALTPNIAINLSKDDHWTLYEVDITDEAIQDRVNEVAQQHGSYQDLETYNGGTTLIYGNLQEVDAEGNPVEGGMTREDAPIMPSYMKDDEQKALFQGCKAGDTIVFNPAKAWEGNATELASLLAVEKEVAEGVKADFAYTVVRMSGYVPSPINQELFDKAFPPAGTITSEEAFRAKIAEQVAQNFATDSDFLFLKEAKKHLLEKAGNVELADDILKRFLAKRAEEKKQKPLSDEDFNESKEALIMELITSKIASAENIKVEEDDVTKASEEYARMQFLRYGMTGVSQDVVARYAKEMLARENLSQQIYDHALENKLIPVLKDKVSIDVKHISEAEMNELFK